MAVLPGCSASVCHASVPVWGDEGMKYVFCAATEEFLEMMGIVVYIYASLTYLVQGRREVALALESHVHQDLGA